MKIDLSKRISTAKLAKTKAGTTVTLAGWAQDIRNLGKMLFIILRDKDGLAQLVVKENKEELAKLNRESVIAITGKVQAGKSTDFKNETVVGTYEILSEAATLPIEFLKPDIDTTLDKRLDWRCIDLHNPKRAAVFKIQSKLVEGALDWLGKEGFQVVFTPCLMGTPSESGAEMFEVPYFDKKAYLRQDPQLHRQLTVVGGFEKIVDIGPSWRAELSHTIRHLCEHRTIAVEFAFLTDERDTMRIEEQMIVAAFKKVKAECKNELKLLGVDITIPKTPFPEIIFPEVYAILKKLGKKVEFGEDIDMDAEQLLGEYVKKKYKHDFYFLNHFPFKKKPFYVMRHDKDWARSVDLEYKGMEMSSGGQREHRYEEIMKNIKEKKMSPSSIEWFTKFFKLGAPPHGGFAIGIERLTQQLLGLDNIREAVLFPRDPERLTP